MRSAGVDAAMNRRGIGEHPSSSLRGHGRNTSKGWCCCAPQRVRIYTAAVRMVFLRLVNYITLRGICGYESEGYW